MENRLMFAPWESTKTFCLWIPIQTKFLACHGATDVDSTFSCMSRDWSRKITQINIEATVMLSIASL